jgi:hypothetical protein
MQPYDYTIQSPLASDSFTQGIQQGLSLNAISQQQRAQQQAQQAAEYQRQRLREVVSKPNAGHREYSALMLEFPQLSEGLKRSFDVFEGGQKKAISSAITPAYAALASGQPDMAIKSLEERRIAAENSGNRELVQAISGGIDAIKRDPTQAKATLYFLGAGADEKFAENASKFGVENRAEAEEGRKAELFPITKRETVAKAGTAESEQTIKAAEAAAVPEVTRRKLVYQNLQNENLAAQTKNLADRYRLDQDQLDFNVRQSLDKLSGNPQSGDAAKLVNDSIIAASKATVMANQSEALAKKFEELGGGYGAFATGAEAWAKLTGNQNAITEARQEFERLAAQQVINLLPPGPATDRDIAIIKQGFPPATADAKTVSNFLRAMARVTRAEAAMSEAKAQWVDSNSSLGRLRKDAEIDGVRVGAGTNFSDFLPQYVKRKMATEKFSTY